MTSVWLAFFDELPTSRGAGCRLCPRSTGRARKAMREHLKTRHPSVWKAFRRVRGGQAV